MNPLLMKLAHAPGVQALLAAIPREKPVKHPSHVTKDAKAPKPVKVPATLPVCVERRLAKRCRQLPFLKEASMRDTLTTYFHLITPEKTEEFLRELRASDRRDGTSKIRFHVYTVLKEAGFSVSDIGSFIHRDLCAVIHGIRRHQENQP